MQPDLRRVSPRIDVEALCWEVVDDKETSALIVDLSTQGARLERPFLGGRIEREVPLQLEVPGIDEVMWAKGDVVFDKLVAAPNAGPFGLLRRTGYRIVIAASRDLRLLRDYVWEMHAQLRAAQQPESPFDLSIASCYR
jgi:hypothetical protein